jgi:hypothetical protein
MQDGVEDGWTVGHGHRIAFARHAPTSTFKFSPKGEESASS